MSIINKINPRFIVKLDKFSIGMKFAEVMETKGKYLIFRENMSVDNTLYSTAGCSVLDAEFIERHIGVFTETHAQEEKEMLEFAIAHKLLVSEVDEYHAYYTTTDSPMTSEEWRNADLNRKHGTYGIIYTSSPTNTYIEGLKYAMTLGEYRLGVFIN